MSADEHVSISLFCDETIEEVRRLIRKLRDVANDLEERTDRFDEMLEGDGA